MKIFFHTEDTEPISPDPAHLIHWITASAREEGFEIQELNFIFCSDNYLLEINQKYLNHDSFTDVITFDHSDQQGMIMGDIFISIDRVKENATIYEVSFLDELCRVMIHGLLHLLGYSDKTDDDKTLMKQKENGYLSLR